MDNYEAAEILRRHKVDSTMDHRNPVEILQAMVEAGHLPGELLATEIEIVSVDEQPLYLKMDIPRQRADTSLWAR